MSTRFNDLLKRAHGAIAQFRGGGGNFFLGRNGEVIFSKNNVCVHESGESATYEEPVHSPGYLTIHCSEDDQLGTTLILQWLPNALLEKTPSSIRCVSPRRGNSANANCENAATTSSVTVARLACTNRQRADSEDEEAITSEEAVVGPTAPTKILLDNPQKSPELCMELNNKDMGEMPEKQRMIRPQTLGGSLGIPSINLIPNTPVEQQQSPLGENDTNQRTAESSEPTSGEDGEGEEEESKSEDAHPVNSSGEEEADEVEEEDGGSSQRKCSSLDALRKSCAVSLTFGALPEQFALQHNLMLSGKAEADGKAAEEARQEEMKQNVQTEKGETEEKGRLEMIDRQQNVVHFHKDKNSEKNAAGQSQSSLFSVNLGKMRSLRVFYSDAERTSGQLVIASLDSQYKIFHFHHAGLDKLTQLFEKWNAVKAKSAVGNDSPSANIQDRQLVICPGTETELAKAELDPEDGLYERLGWDLWRSYVSDDGSIEDCFTIRKTIYFSSMEKSLRKEVWPFLLRVYPWNSTLEQRDTIRNDMFLRYQRLKGQRMRRMAKEGALGRGERQLAKVEWSIGKDVVRTDRRNSFFAGDENANLETMKSILLTYAVKYPEIGYIQGMSDLLAPLLSTLRDECLAYWCFVQLMDQTLFSQPPPDEQRSVMDIQLDYLRELIRLFSPAFHAHLAKLGGDAPALMFVHRWILLFFKREFPASDALHIWEACWARYRTNFFHLFIACAIVNIYCRDVVAQQLPHDEILFYFSSLAMHMDARIILSKARGLLYQFCRMPRLPCTLAGLRSHDDAEAEQQWTLQVEAGATQYECTQRHAHGEQCPYAGGSGE